MTRRELFRVAIGATVTRTLPFVAPAALAADRLAGFCRGTGGRVYRFYQYRQVDPGALWSGYFLTRVNGHEVVAGRVIARGPNRGHVSWTADEFAKFGRDSVQMAQTVGYRFQRLIGEVGPRMVPQQWIAKP